ncbi:AmmeMemoRadiSam system protein B [Thiocapsa imhoffii]|uniref:MEMO1 family protein CKO25_00330 n=1 Tax=Thiocapsa imhoffii TaxID=382777 RepID=A0A9X0WEB0_9GAMM|nr:AmmeMemoRadiSam system protein B [Thiocapsa imhoffii]MBK1643124.1 AmmeMemoRadiSam system protein B [Thiocapsa imhoffii]
MRLARHPAVAGTFYPADPQALKQAVAAYLAEVTAAAPPPKALIVPHAGYRYSGPIAARAYATLIPVCKRITRVVLLGPAHRVAIQGLAASRAGQFDTPLGPVSLDRAAIDLALTLPQVVLSDEAHALEHSIEVQLPFLQATLDGFHLVPLVVGDAAPGEVARVLDVLWGGPETLILISSDLSHYLDDATARRRDAATTLAIEQLRPQDIGPDQACGCIPVRALLEVAQRRGLEVRTLDLRHSGDTTGPRERVVGYGAYAFY